MGQTYHSEIISLPLSSRSLMCARYPVNEHMKPNRLSSDGQSVRHGEKPVLDNKMAQYFYLRKDPLSEE